MKNPVIFILDATNTFTPSRGGAPAIIYHHCCMEARSGAWSPHVIARRASVPLFGGTSVIFVDPPGDHAAPALVLAMRAERKLLGYRRMGHRLYVDRVIRALRTGGFQCAPKITSGDPELAVCLARAFPAAPVLLWFHTSQDCKPRFQRALPRSAVRCVAVSEFTSRANEAYFSLPAGAVTTVYNAVDTAHFASPPVPPNGPPVLNYHGRLGHDKGTDLLLSAAHILAKKGLRFGIQLIGSNHPDGLIIDEYQRGLFSQGRELESLGIEVRRPGHLGREELPGEVRKAHIHVCTSRWDEPFGMATLEGMACGLATVASNTGGTPEVVGDAGFLFERGNVEQLAGHLERLILDEGLRREYAAKARQRAEQFTWAKTWAGVRDVITG